MMSSLTERMSVLKRIVIKPHEEFVIEVNNGIVKSEILGSIASIEYEVATGKSTVVIHMLNPNEIEHNSDVDEAITTIQAPLTDKSVWDKFLEKHSEEGKKE